MSLAELKPSDVLKTCARVSELIYAGRFEEAREALGELWRGVGRYPETDLYPPEVAAEVLLQCASLSGCLGSAQGKATQESTKDMLTRALEIFEAQHNQGRVRDTQYELGICYWRSGAFDEARVVLAEALKEATGEQRGKILIGCTIAEVCAGRYEEARDILLSERFFFDETSHALQGRWHNEMAIILRRLASAANQIRCFDKAIIEYTAAIYHYEQAGHVRYCGNGLNNLAFIYHYEQAGHVRYCGNGLNNLAFLQYKLGRYAEAHEHLNKAHRIFTRLRDAGNIAQVEETKARVLIAEEKYTQAGKVIAKVIDVLERCGEKALLVDALTIKATAQARLGEREESLNTFRSAIRTGQQSGASFNAGLAALSLIEEHKLSNKRLYKTYRLADRLLSVTQDAEAIERLRECAERVIIQLGGPQVGKDFCLPDALHEIEAELIIEALDRAQGKITRAAKLLGITHQSLSNILNHRHSQLLEKRTPIRERRKSTLK